MRRSSLAADDRELLWPAWLFSAAVHAAGLIVAASCGVAAVLRGGALPPLQPAGIVLELALVEDVPAVLDAEAEPAPIVDSAAPARQAEAVELPPIEPPPETASAETDETGIPAVVEPAGEAQATELARPSVLGLEELAPDDVAARPGAAAAGARRGAPRTSFRVGQIGGRTTVRVFGVEGTGTKFVYLFDRSTSMAGAPLAAAQMQLVGSFAALESVHQFHVIFFNHRVHAWSGSDGAGRIAFATDRNKELAAKFVQATTASGGTDRLGGLREALGLAPDVVFFLTDADDTMPAADVAEAVQRASRTGTTIACIEFGTGPSRGRENFLTELARSAGGQYGYVDVLTLPR
ncbi:MAG: hypothetical protein KF688_08745 [Pirellulales bacterium]|nr:hypothetical protein [Pirellulales bacterium]